MEGRVSAAEGLTPWRDPAFSGLGFIAAMTEIFSLFEGMDIMMIWGTQVLPMQPEGVRYEIPASWSSDL